MMRRSAKRFQDLMAAVTFAQAGEPETAKAILRERERVLLALREEHIEARTLRYALNTCKRIGADLDILYISSLASTAPALGGFLEELEQRGIRHRLVKASGCLQQAIIDYVNSQTDVAFAVVDTADSLEPGCQGRLRGLSGGWEEVKCPLVVVGAGAHG
jgi:hypothetical protein